MLGVEEFRDGDVMAANAALDGLVAETSWGHLYVLAEIAIVIEFQLNALTPVSSWYRIVIEFVDITIA
jgi:hypothetical protein